jgi:hypothetical protein
MNLRVWINDDYSLDLLNIGRINVLSGINSSDKTSVLRAIDRKDYERGLTVRELLSDQMAKSFGTLFSPYPETGHGPANQARDRAIKFVEANLNKLLFLGELPKFVDDVRGVPPGDRSRQFQFSDIKLRDDLQAQIAKKLTTTYLSAKRQLDYDVEFQADEQPLGVGHGVIHNLFKAQNSRTDADLIDKLVQIETAFEEVTGGIQYAIELDGRVLRALFRFQGRELRRAEDCGLGLQDILVILYSAVFDPAEILLIEEPENHLHPLWLRALIRYIREQTSKVVFLSTHSSTLLDSALVDRVFVTEFRENRIYVTDAESKIDVLKKLGFIKSDFLTANVLALVEGQTDQEAIEAIMRAEYSEPFGRVAFHILGGDGLLAANFGHLVEAFDYVAAFVDSEIDSGSKRARRKFKAKCEQAGVPCKLSDKPNLEFYFSPAAYRKVFKSSVVPDSWAFDVKVADQLGFNPKGSIADLASATEWDYLSETDLGAFIVDIADHAGLKPKLR